jgi:hypothetical protein
VEQRSARLPVTQETVGSNPIGDAQHGTVRQSGRATKLKPWWMGVRVPLVLLEQHASAGHWRAQVAVTHPLPSCGGSTPSRRTDNMARSSNGSGYETLILVIRVRLPYGLLNDFIAGATGVQSAFIRPMRSARYRDLQLDAGGRVLIQAS